MKKTIACLTAVALMASVAAPLSLTGCGRDENEIRILLLANNAEDPFYRDYFASLESKYGVTIRYNGYEEDGYYQKLKGEIQGGTTPDIFYVRPNEILQYRKRITSLESYANSLDPEFVDLSDVYTEALDMYRYKDGKMDASGELYAFPKDLSTQQLGYNKNVIGACSEQIKTKYPSYKLPWEEGFTGYTWEQFHDICEVISNVGTVKVPNKQGTLVDIEPVGCDIPDIEILAKSKGGTILNKATDTVTVNNEAVQWAVDYQAALCTPREGYAKPAADFNTATFANFRAFKVAFYGKCGSWEISQYDSILGEGNWDVMPWPTVDGSTNWYGMITSAGYVVSKDANRMDVCKEIAASFMSQEIQQKMVNDVKISLPLLKSLKDSYVDPENDYNSTDKTGFTPKSRSVYINVIDHSHGFYPAKYSTYNATWLEPLDTALNSMWNYHVTNGPAWPTSNKPTLSTIQTNMQNVYNEIKDKG